MRFLTLAALVASLAAAQQVTKETVPGITNFAQVETTVAIVPPWKSRLTVDTSS